MTFDLKISCRYSVSLSDKQGAALQIFLTDALTFITADLCLPDNPTASHIPRHQLHDHAITDENPNEIPLRPAADNHERDGG